MFLYTDYNNGACGFGNVSMDLTNYSKMTITMSAYSATGTGSSVKFRMASLSDGDVTFQIAYPEAPGTYTVDVSSYTGQWEFYCYANYGQNYTISELYLQ